MEDAEVDLQVEDGDWTEETAEFYDDAAGSLSDSDSQAAQHVRDEATRVREAMERVG